MSAYTVFAVVIENAFMTYTLQLLKVYFWREKGSHTVILSQLSHRCVCPVCAGQPGNWEPWTFMWLPALQCCGSTALLPCGLAFEFWKESSSAFLLSTFLFFFPPHYFSLWMLIITHSWTYYFQFLNLPFSYLLCPRFPKGKKKRAFQLFLLIPFASYLYS